MSKGVNLTDHFPVDLKCYLFIQFILRCCIGKHLGFERKQYSLYFRFYMHQIKPKLGISTKIEVTIKREIKSQDKVYLQITRLPTIFVPPKIALKFVA